MAQGKEAHQEKIPERLLEKARQAIPAHGVMRVANTIGVEHSRLMQKAPQASLAALTPPSREALQPQMPSYSRIELQRPAQAITPIAEVENSMGVKLRVFELTAETVNLLAALVGYGRVP